MTCLPRRTPLALVAATLATALGAIAGCTGGGGSALTSDRFNNTVWEETCEGDRTATAYLRFLPDGTFAWSTGGLAPGDFQHDGDDRWGAVGRTLVVTWDDEAAVTTYRPTGDGDVFSGSSSRPCGDTARLERVR